MPVNPHVSMLHHVTVALRATHAELAQHAGVSRRTVQRWSAGGGIIPGFEALRLAKVVHPVDRELASELARTGGTTLEALGLEGTAAASQVPLQPPQALPEHADSVVYAAADALELAPKAVRPAVVAAFQQALRLGLTVEALLPTLANAKGSTPRK